MEAARDEVTSKLADTVATHEKVRGALLVQLQELQSEQRANLKKIEEQERTTEHLRAKLQQPRPVSIAPQIHARLPSRTSLTVFSMYRRDK